MRQLDRYGLAEHQYEGVGEVQFTGRDPTKVYFDARQMPDATLVVGCVAMEGSLSGDPYELTGHTLDRRSFQSAGPLITVSHRITNGYQSAELLCREIRVGADVTLSTLEPVRFALYNYAFGQRDAVPLRPIDLDWGTFRISISAADDYASRIAQLRSAGGVAQTAWCSIAANKPLPDREFPLDEARSLADDVVDALSLATGTLVTWHYCVGTAWSGSKTQHLHQAAVSKTFAKLVLNQRWFASAGDAIRAWLDPAVDAKIGRDDLRVYVHQQCDSCSEEAFFETRALSAATLLDVVAGRYAEQTDTQNFVTPNDWQAKVLPALHGALDALDGLTAEQRGEASQNLSHMYRRGFRRNLRKLLTDLEVPVKNTTLTKVIASRNTLTHSGHFHSKSTEKHFQEYLRLVLLGRCILLTAAGVKNDLHRWFGD
jgi:hypothetical protein